jgi:hypothetical protein
MASHHHDFSTQGAATVPNRGGRPRKYATLEEARAQESERQKLKRHQQRQSRESKSSHSMPKTLQFIPYQPLAITSKNSPAKSTLKLQQELCISSPLYNPPPLLQQQPIQEAEGCIQYESSGARYPELKTGSAIAEQGLTIYPVGNEHASHAANTIEVAAILSSMQFYFL